MSSVKVSAACVVIASVLVVLFAHPAWGITTGTGSFAGLLGGGTWVKGVQAGGAGASPVTYWYNHSASCPGHGATTTGWVALGPVPLADGANGTPPGPITTTFPPTGPHHGSWDTSEWEFDALNVAGDVLLTDGGGGWAIKSTAHAAVPPPGEPGVATATCKTAVEIGGQMFGPVAADESVLRLPWGLGWMGPDRHGAKVRLKARTAAGALADDAADYGSTWTLSAPGYAPIDVFSEAISLQADGEGSVASSLDEGLFLAGSYATLSMNMSSVLGSFDGTAQVVNGTFSATGGLAGLPWQLDHADPGDPFSSITGAFLAAADVPSGEFDIKAGDVAPASFFDADPAWDGRVSKRVSEAVQVPEPASLALLALGLLAIVSRRR